MCTIKDFENLGLNRIHPFYKVPLRSVIEAELDVWHRCYPLGKNVLDAGAGCGETAQFYLNHGAEKVLSIESNAECHMMLVENFKNDSRVIPLLLNLDAIKLDIEGAEKAMIVETHFPFYLRLLHAFPETCAYIGIWKLEEAKIVSKLMRKSLYWATRGRYLRIQLAHFVREMFRRVTGL